MTPTQALKHALDLEQERSRTFEAVVKVLQAELKAERLKAAALREAAGALVRDLEDPNADQIWMCDRCPSVAMVHAEGGVCDAHADGREVSRDLSYAAPLRALRALLPKAEG